LHYNLDYPTAEPNSRGKDSILCRPLKQKVWFE